MKLKLIIKKNKKTQQHEIVLWIQQKTELSKDLNDIIKFFKNEIIVSKKNRLHTYLKIHSENPAIMLSLLSSLQEILPDIYFSQKT